MKPFRLTPIRKGSKWHRSNIDGVEMSVAYEHGRLWLNSIRVSCWRRGEGLGTRAMQALIIFAMQHQLELWLIPKADYAGTYQTRLESWYRALGFVWNKEKTEMGIWA